MELHDAAYKGDVARLRMLLDQGAYVSQEDPEENNDTPLHTAAAAGQAECVHLLLERGADKDATNKRTETPLSQATSRGHSECVRALLDAGADMEIRERWNGRALHCAADGGHAECVRLLLQKGARIESLGESGRKPLHHAASQGHPECVRLLLDAGANINATHPRWDNDKGGFTPLMEATSSSEASYARPGHAECVRLLLERGADPDLKKDEHGPGLRRLDTDEVGRALVGVLGSSDEGDE